MERLTNKREADLERQNYEKRLEQGYPRNIPEERFLRLAAYEDTGLEPEEMVGLQKQNDLLAQYGAQKFSASMEDFREINSLKLKIQSLEMSLSVACDGLNKYTQAEQEGRFVVLPCKVGDWVYALWDVPTAAKYVIYCAEVKEIRRSNRNCRLTTTYLLEPIEYRGRRKEYRDDDFGKTVFLTCEEAERALNQMAKQTTGTEEQE